MKFCGVWGHLGRASLRGERGLCKAADNVSTKKFVDFFFYLTNCEARGMALPFSNLIY